MATNPIYKGFSSVSVNDNIRSNTEMFDVNLVKQDLLNHFNTRYREVPGRPGFGCAIYNLLAEPFDDITEVALREEVERVIRYDPRVEITGFDVTLDRSNSGAIVSVSLLYKELGQEEIIAFAIALPR
jgi:phage baseplate assembly protein W